MRLYLYGGIALALFLAGFGSAWTIQGWRLQARQTAAVEAARAAERLAQQNVIDSYKADIKAAQESSNGYQAEAERLRNRPVPTLRVCKPARGPAADLPRETTAPRRSDDATEAGRLVPPATEDDIGRQLVEFATQADLCSAQTRGLIDWINRTR